MLMTLDDIKNYLGIPLSNHSQDDFLTMQGELLTEAIEGYCGRAFNLATYTQKFYAEELGKYGLKELYLYHYPLVTLNSVTEDEGTPIIDADELKAYCRIVKDESILVRNYPDTWFKNCTEVVEIEYSAGYSTLPAPIKYTFLSIIEVNYNKKLQGLDLNFGRDVQRISIPGALSIDFDYTLDANERKNRFGAILNGYLNILDNYRSERVVTGQIGRKYES